MKPLRRKCIYNRSDNFKAILNQFFNGGKQFVPDDVMKAIRNETHYKTNILYNYEIPLTIPILECILKRNKMTKYKNSIYYIFFKINGQPFPYVTAREYDMLLNAFNIVSSIYDKYKPKGRKSFLNYYFVLKNIDNAGENQAYQIQGVSQYIQSMLLLIILPILMFFFISFQI